MMHIETIETEHSGVTIEIYEDMVPLNPRKEYDNLGTIASVHPDIRDESGLDREDMAAIMNGNKHVWLPVYIYSHSGIMLNTTGFSCPWDSGQTGIIYVSKEQVRNEYGCKRISRKMRHQIEKYLKNEVEVFSLYVEGRVYGYEVVQDGDALDSCWGFFGEEWETNGLLESAMSSIPVTLADEVKATVA